MSALSVTPRYVCCATRRGVYSSLRNRGQWLPAMWIKAQAWSWFQSEVARLAMHPQYVGGVLIWWVPRTDGVNTAVWMDWEADGTGILMEQMLAAEILKGQNCGASTLGV